MADVALTAGDRRIDAQISTRGEETVVQIGGRESRLRLHRLDATTWRVVGDDGTARIARIIAYNGTWWLHVGGEILVVRPAETAGRPRGAARRPEPLEAPMPGTVTQIPVREGETVAAGQPIVIIEAMKMEHVIRAPHAGRVVGLRVRSGEQVEAGAVVAEIQSGGPSAAGEPPRP